MVASSAQDLARASIVYGGQQDGSGKVRFLAGFLRDDGLVEQANLFKYCHLVRRFEGWIRRPNARPPFARVSSTS